MNNDRQPLTRAGAACLILLAAMMPSLSRAQSSGDDLALKLRNNVVKITAKRESGESAHGFGFVVGKHQNQLYIVTANHVVRSNRPGGASKSVKVKFFSDPGRSFEAILLETFYGKPQDFAVIQVPAPANFLWESKALLPLESFNAGLRGKKVWFIGRSGKWYIPTIPGSINSEKPDLHSIIHVDMVSVRVGTSGAPLITENGIIGMIIQDEIGSARAVSIAAIKVAFEEWRYPWSLQARFDNTPYGAKLQTATVKPMADKTPALAKLPAASSMPKTGPADPPPDLGYRVAVLPLELRNDASRYKIIFNRLIEESIAETEFFTDYRFYDLNTRHKTNQSEIIFDDTLMNNLWLKKGFFSKPELNTGFIIELGHQLGVDAVLVFSANIIELGKDRIKALLVDVKNKNIYSSSGLTDFVLSDDTDQILQASGDAKRITKKVFAEYKNRYHH